MVLRMLGAAALAELMRSEQRPQPVTDWLLFGPQDPEIVETRPEAPTLLLAAE